MPRHSMTHCRRALELALMTPPLYVLARLGVDPLARASGCTTPDVEELLINA